MLTCDDYTVPSCGGTDDQTFNSIVVADSTLAHSKDRNWSFDFQGFTIIMNRRQREFSLSYNDDYTTSIGKFIPDDEGGFIPCDITTDGTYTASIFEDATFVDSEIYFFDPDMGVCFYKETTETCTFAATSKDIVAFKETFGTQYYHKIVVGKVDTIRTERYYLIKNGIRTLFDKTITVWPYNDHLNIVWPQPPSLGIVFPDADLDTYGFYDYNAGGPEEALAMAMTEGGKDFYYPGWLQQMGVDKTQDEQDALDRFYAYFLGEGDSGGSLSVPAVPYGVPRGNAIKDAEGNIVMSFTAANTTGANVNRIYLPDETFVDVSYLFDKPHIYPVGVLTSDAGNFDATKIDHDTRYGIRDENGELLTDENGDVLTTE